MLLNPELVLKNNRLWQSLCIAVSVLAGVFHLANLQPGHNWGDDFSQYIAHAVNIAEGKSYKDIKHLQTPLLPIAPETYPVVFPLLLAPLYLVFGLDLAVFKVLGIICFTGFLLMLWPVFRPWLSGVAVFCITLLLAFNPSFFNFKENILSEFPFLFFLFVAFYVLRKAMLTTGTRKQFAFYGLAGISIFLVAGCRSIGIVLVPAWIGGVLLSKTRPENRIAGLAISLAVFGVLYSLQALYLNDSSDGYLDQFLKLYRPNIINNNVEDYFQKGTWFWEQEVTHKVRLILFSVLVLLSVMGFLLRSIVHRPGIFEIFTVGFLVLTMIWPWFQGYRFLVPIIPLGFFYAFYFIDHSLSRFPVKSFLVSMIFLVFWGWPYLVSYSERKEKNYTNFLRPDTIEMFSFIRQLPPQARLVFPKPRVIALYTSHYTMVSLCMDDLEKVDRFLQENKIDYLIFSKKDFPGETGCYLEYTKQYPEKVKLQFANEGYVIYLRKQN